MPACLKRYQVMSYVVGTMLLIFCATIVMRHGFGVAPKVEMVVAQIHGILYMIYLVTVVEVAVKLKPSLGRVALMVFSGVIPVMAFIVEPRIVRAFAEEDAA